MICVLFLYIFLMLGGATINVFNPDISPSETAFIWAARNVLPVWLGVIVVTGISGGRSLLGRCVPGPDRLQRRPRHSAELLE